MQPFQCDLQPQLQETHRTTPQEQPLVAKHIEGTNRVRNDRSRTRRTHEVPFIVACSHFTRKNTRFRAPASSPKHSPCNIHAAITMRSATTDSKTPYNYARTSTPNAAWSHHYNAAKKKANRPQPQSRADEVPFIAGCSHFTRKNTRFRAPASSRKQSPCNIMQPFQCDLQPEMQPEIPPLAFVTTSLPHHFPLSPLPIITTSLRHHFSSSPLPIVTTSLRPLPFLTTSLPHHFPSSPPRFLTTPLHHHFLFNSPPFIKVKSQCDVLLCHVKSHTTLHQGQVSMWCIVMSCKVSHHPSSRSSLNVMYCYVM